MTPDSTTALRAHVDGAVSPAYELLFGVLDALHAHEQRHPLDRDPTRITELRGLLDDRLRDLERADADREHARVRQGSDPRRRRTR